MIGRAAIGRAALLALALAGARPAAGAEEPLVVDLKLSVSAPRVVRHQQVVLELSVRHPLYARPRWEPPAFEGFWSERLPAAGGPLEWEPDGRPVRTTRMRRALFPTRAGALEIAGSRLFVRDRGGAERAVAVPPTQIRVDPLPAAGRPAAFRGVVGQLELKVDLDAREVAVGRALALTVDLHGRANLWDAAPPALDALLDPSLEVFADPPRQALGERRGELSARRSHRFELVPTRTGRFAIPELAVAYFDPAAGAYRLARTEPAWFEAVERPAATRPPWQAPASRPEPLSGAALLGAGLAALAAVAAGGYGVTLWWRRSLHAWLRAPAPRPRALLERAGAAAEEGERARLLRAALGAAIRVRHGLDAGALTPDEVARRIEDAEAIHLLRALEAQRFSGRKGGLDDTLQGRVGAYVDAAGARVSRAATGPRAD